MTSFATFRELELEESLTNALDKMGFTEPTPIQQQTITQALAGRDILGCAQTGTGKTGAFGIPLIQYLLLNPDKKALILAPTRELADQINRTLALMAFSSYGIRIALIIGGASMGQQVRMLSQGARVIVATPGRLIDLLSQRKVALGNVGILVLDEVDRMLDMGFAPQLEQIVPHLPSERQAMLFSATLPPEIMKLAESYLRNPVRVTVGEQLAAATTVEQKMIQTQQDSKQELLLKELADMSGKAIVFVKTQHGTERLAKVVRAAGFRADRLHGGRTHMQRKRALDNFRKGETQILVATDIAGRGIDIDDIEYVVNFDMPKTQEDYIHRIGRTGRYGRTGIALNFVTYEDMRLMRLLDPESYPSRRGPSSGSTGSGMRRGGGREAGGYNNTRSPASGTRRP
ncbi:MAG: DEAD/DEAH box helicase, partial [Acidobacteriota bacterium]